MIAHQAGHPAQAVELIQAAVSLAPDHPEYHNLLGLDLMALGRWDEAENSFRRALALHVSSDGYNNLGVLWKEQGRVDDAIGAFGQALTLDPGDAAAHFNQGTAYRAKGDLESAVNCFRRSIEIEPEDWCALAALGETLQKQLRHQEAVTFLNRAILLRPDHADLFCVLGDALQSAGDLAGADAAYKQSLELNPKLSRAWYSAGCSSSAQNEYAKALICFRKALEIHPNWPEAQHNLGGVLFKLGQVEEALDLFRQACVAGNSSLSRAAIAVIIPGSAASDNQTIYDTRRAWTECELPVTPKTLNKSVKAGKLRIGYVSSFFAHHNWMKPVWGLINHHDREHFEVHLFSDAAASNIQHGYHGHPQDCFYDTTELSNDALAQLVEKKKIDLLVDLNGYSNVRRLALFAMRPASVIVGWFNMFATTGMAGYDYLIGDDVVIPAEEEKFYCEKIARAPGSYLTFEVSYPVPPVADPPFLTNAGITYGCLAPLYKITREVVESWSSILREVPHSLLSLKNRALGSLGNQDFLRALFAQYGVAPERLRLSGSASHFQFLEAYSQIDIALDTFPYNGGTTTTEAIWQGVPVITFRGDRWVARTSASILHAGTLGEWVGEGVDDYVSLAVALANSPDRLVSLRRNMRKRLLGSPVCDTQGFARNMELLYRQFLAT